MPISETYNIDCIEGMKKHPDNFFNLAIVDPPYFDGPQKLGYYGARVNSRGVKNPQYDKIGTWDIPSKDYFDELYRVSKHQIIWGCNYYAEHINDVGRIIWDKVNGDSSFSDCEVASCSLHDSVRIYSYMWNGFMQGKSMNDGRTMQGNKKLNEKRIHPTQKPVLLYGWLLQKYAKEGFKILDTHLGSGSSRIAAWKLGFDFYGYETEEKYFTGQQKRFINECQAKTLFT